MGRDVFALIFSHKLLVISIHAPRVGRDSPRADILYPHIISIHAPRVGRDGQERVYISRISNFNPRAPCGARHLLTSTLWPLYEFQSTRPVWGATAKIPNLNYSMSIFLCFCYNNSFIMQIKSKISSKTKSYLLEFPSFQSAKLL